MPKKKKEEKEQTLVFLLFLYIVGLGLLMGGILWGILFVGLGILFTIALFPKVGEIIKTIIEGIMRLIQKKKASTPSPTSFPSTELKTGESHAVEEIIQTIREFTPSKPPKNEEDCENMLVSYLQAFFPKIRRQKQYPNMRIDVVIDKIGIEIKFQPSRYDFHALYSQVEDRLKYLDQIIITVFGERDKMIAEDFIEKLKRRGWFNNKIFIISKS